MLSIQEIKLTIETLKKFKAKDYEEFFRVYLEKLEQLALRVDAYNDSQILALDKTTDWYMADLNWRHERKEFLYDPLVDKNIQMKISNFSKQGGEAKYNSLEIGPGYGRHAKMMLAWRINYYLDLLPQCESKLKKLFDPPQYKYMRFYSTDRTSCEKIPDHSVNFVFSWDTFTFFTQIHIERYLRDIHRVMIPGGYAFIHYADCQFDYDLRESKRGYWNFNTKTVMQRLVTKCGYKVIEMDQFKPGANFVIFQKPGNMNPVVYKVMEIPTQK